MKNAKKLLSLVLVLVLAMSLIPFASATPAEKNANDYPDFDGFNEDYIEAIDVVTALGVMEGYDTGSFGYANTITRAEAAAILTRSIIGTAAAKRLGPAGPRFTDVPRDHWANPYVEYCAANGIIDGYGDGTFHPSEPVTASQMAKLLLMAIGYGKKGEYVGANWELFTISDGQRYGILTTDSDYTAPAMREEVAQFTFNALARAKLVTYNSVLDNYFENDDNVWGSDSNYTTLGQKTFGLYATADWDAYGFRGCFWSVRTPIVKVLTGYYQTDLILSKSTDGTPVDAMSATSRSLTERGRAGFVARFEDGITAETVEMWVNGREIPVQGVASNYLTRDEALRVAAISGVTVSLADSFPYNGLINRVVIVAPTVHEALGAPVVAGNGNVTIPGASAGGLQFTVPGGAIGRYVRDGVSTPLTIPGVTTQNVSNLPATRVEYDDGIVEGDILLVHEKIVDGILVSVVEKAATVSGQMTEASSASSPPTMTFSGATYRQSGLTPGILFSRPSSGANSNLVTPVYYGLDPFAIPHDTVAATNPNFDKDAIIWLDDNGDVVNAKLVNQAPPTYGLVLYYQFFGGISPRASVVMATVDDGVKTYNVAVDPATGRVPTHVGATGGTGNILGDNAVVTNYAAFNNATVVTYEFTENGDVKLTVPGSDKTPTNTRYEEQAGRRTHTLSSAYLKNTTRVDISSPGGGALAGGVKYITADTTVFYFDFTNPYSLSNPQSTPVYASIGTSGANDGVATGRVQFVQNDKNGQNLDVVVFCKTNANATPGTTVFVARTNYTRSYLATPGNEATRRYEYEVWTHKSGVMEAVTLVSDSSALFGTGSAGFWTYTTNRTTGLSTASRINSTATTDPNNVIQRRGLTFANYNSTTGGSVQFNAGAGNTTMVTVDSSTKYFMYTPSSAGHPGNGGYANDGAPNTATNGTLGTGAVSPLNVSNISTLESQGIYYYIWGVQMGTGSRGHLADVIVYQQLTVSTTPTTPAGGAGATILAPLGTAPMVQAATAAAVNTPTAFHYAAPVAPATMGTLTYGTFATTMQIDPASDVGKFLTSLIGKTGAGFTLNASQQITAVTNGGTVNTEFALTADLCAASVTVTSNGTTTPVTAIRGNLGATSLTFTTGTIDLSAVTTTGTITSAGTFTKITATGLDITVGHEGDIAGARNVTVTGTGDVTLSAALSGNLIIDGKTAGSVAAGAFLKDATATSLQIVNASAGVTVTFNATATPHAFTLTGLTAADNTDVPAAAITYGETYTDDTVSLSSAASGNAGVVTAKQLTAGVNALAKLTIAANAGGSTIVGQLVTILMD